MNAKAENTNIKIPALLEEAIKGKRTVLFLGAGASMEARDKDNKRPPDSDQLRDILAQRFFAREIKNRDVMAVAEMAIAASGSAGQVYEAVSTALEGFEPSEAHKLLTTFSWRSIATTNYDLLVERAYSNSNQRLQSLVRFVKDDEPIDERLQEAANPVQYLKLHGCLDHIHDGDIPLVLSREHYAFYSKNRTRLFNRLKDLAREHTFLFVGYRLDDPHIREIIYDLEAGQRPRWFMVTPDAEDYDINFWATKNIEVVQSRFGQFMRALDAAISPQFRSLPIADSVADFPIRRFFSTQTTASALFRDALTSDLTFIHADMPYKEQLPKKFYEGYDTGWGGIVHRFDVRRRIEDDLLFKALLENEEPTEPVLITLRGPAGSGKSIALKRSAYEAATASDALVLWLNENGALKPEVFLELHDLTQKVIYLFVDQIALHVDKVHTLLRRAHANKIPLVVCAAERDSDWNTYCGPLENDFSVSNLRVGYLSEAEINGLLDLLEHHGCLGELAEKTRPERIRAFMEIAERQLLVALHELTQGKPFEEVVFTEHQRINPEQARQLYLDIATMHQFKVHVRAGTISRISGIGFGDYEKHFFAPLQNVVKVERDRYTGDYGYKTRHARIAYLVFKQACPTDDDKAHQFIRLLGGLDVGYSADRRAFEEMTRGRSMAEAFSGVSAARSIYEMAVAVAPMQAFIHQQWAIFELNHQKGSMDFAEVHASHARELDPYNQTIIHTQAEIDRRKANEENSSILKDQLRRRARERLNEIPHSRFVASSRAKLLVDEITELSKTLEENAPEHQVLFFTDKIRDAESTLARAQQQFPDDADIIQTEARLRQMLNQEDRALRALQRAWEAGPRGSAVAIKIADIYEARGRIADTLGILNDALARYPGDKALHQAIALHYLKQDDFNPGLVESHLRNSFSSDDENFEARYLLAQFFFLMKNIEATTELFDFIGSRAPETFRRVSPRRETVITARLPRFSGNIDSIRDSYLFIRSGAYPRNIFCHFSQIDPDVLSELSVGEEVNFKIRFNRNGPTAVDVKPGRAP